jgi:RNA polymerase sporulation-specific sigma factor
MSFGWLTVLALLALRGILLLTGYLSNSTAFPHPLSAEEEREQIRLLKAGDPKARAVLIEHNLRLVAHIVKKFEGCGEDPEDLISIGTVGLIKGVEAFDPSKGTRLATFAARCIENEVLIPTPGIRSQRSAEAVAPGDRDPAPDGGHRTSWG